LPLLKFQPSYNTLLINLIFISGEAGSRKRASRCS